MINFFSVFDLSPSFDLDLTDLEKRYFTVQRSCHPDRLIGKPPAERQQAIMRSMQANEAFEALKLPLQRARHLLALQGIHVGSENDNVKPNHQLLVEIMELREALEESGSADDVHKLKAENSDIIKTRSSELSASFNNGDYQQAAQLTIELGYLLKIEDDIRLKLKTV